MGKILTTIKIALKNLMYHKMRSFLTMTGIVIGIAMVTIVFSVGEGLRGFIIGQVQSFGSNILFVEARPPELTVVITLITTLKVEQMEEIKRNKTAFPHVDKAYAYLAGQGIARSKYEEITIDINGTNEDYIDIDAAEVAEGRFFTDKEEQSMKRVVVLGSEAAKKLFPTGHAINKDIKIDNINFKVIGVLKEKGPDMFMNVDKMVFIPLKVVQKMMQGIDYILFFAVGVDDKKYLDETKEQMERFLRKKHNIHEESKDDFAITSADEAVKIVDDILIGVRILLLVLGMISLVVGGVGIMNIMYVTVSERIKEIGLRKAVGARSRDILYQFILEAIVVTFIGGFLGVVLGVLVTLVIAIFAQDYGFKWEYFVSTQGIMLSLIVTVVCGIVFGLAPARKAARQDPIKALRYE